MIFNQINKTTFVWLFVLALLRAGTSQEVWLLNAWERALRDSEIGGRREIFIRAAQNEWESFQILIRSKRKEKVLNITFSDFTGPKGQKIPKDNFVLYREHQLHIVKGTYRNKNFKPGWYPDALIPLRHPLTGEILKGARFQALPFDLPPNQTHGFWVDFFVPEGSLPGEYSSKCTVLLEGKGKLQLSLKLEVLPVVLPRRFSLKTHFGSPAERIIGGVRRQVRKGKLPSEFSPKEIRKVCAKLATDHRINTFPPPELLRFKLNPDGSFSLPESRIAALKAFVDRYPVNLISVPAPHRFFKDPVREREKIFAYLRSWDKVMSQLGRKDILCCTYPFDEPNDREAYEFVRKWGKIVKEANTKVKVLVTEQTKPQKEQWGNLYGAVDIWVPLFSLFDPQYAEKRRKLGESIWTYTALCQGRPTPWWHIDFPIYHYRIPCWIAWRYHMEGLLYWGGMAWWNAVEDPWTDPATYPPPERRRRYVFNGEGSLLYPAFNVGFQGAVPSMRLKALRDGIEDYEYLKILESRGKRKEAEEIVLSVAASWYEWAQDPTEYVRARERISELLKLVAKEVKK